MLAAALAAPQLAVAQDDSHKAFAEPTDRQVQLNRKAVGAIGEGNPIEAINLLEESNYIAPLNITYLNLGRAYQRLDQCKDARRAFDASLKAPPVEQPPPGLVAQKANQFLGELAKECPNEDAAANGEPEKGPRSEASAEPASNPPNDTTSASKRPANEAKATDESLPDTEPAAAPATESDNLSGWGWTALAGGVVLIGGGTGMHFWAESMREEVRDPTTNPEGQVTSITQADAVDNESSANTLDTVGVSAIGVGAVSAAIGVYLLMTNNHPDQQPAVSVGVSDHGVVCGWQTRF